MESDLTPQTQRAECVHFERTIGSEVRGVDLHRPLEAGLVAQLRSWLVDRKVLVFPEQHLSPDELERFTRYFGEPFTRGGDYAGPDIFGGNRFVGSIGPTPVGQRPTTWHLGGTWQTSPLVFELLTLVVVPEVGGATLYADLQAAYDALSAPMKYLAGHCRAAHSTQVKPSGRAVDSGDVFDPTDFVEHPLVLTHPETGRKGLYLTSRITHLVGIPAAESSAILAFLRSHASGVDYQFRQRWRSGDLVVWDNRATWHRAVDDYGDDERWGYKTAVLGNGWRPT